MEHYCTKDTRINNPHIAKLGSWFRDGFTICKNHKLPRQVGTEQKNWLPCPWRSRQGLLLAVQSCWRCYCCCYWWGWTRRRRSKSGWTRFRSSCVSDATADPYYFRKGEQNAIILVQESPIWSKMNRILTLCYTDSEMWHLHQINTNWFKSYQVVLLNPSMNEISNVPATRGTGSTSGRRRQRGPQHAGISVARVLIEIKVLVWKWKKDLFHP